MKRQHILFAAALSVSFFTASSVYAAPATSSPVHAMFFFKVKTVKLSLRNDTSSAIEVKVGEQVMTLDPGKPVALSLPVGTRIVTNTATPSHPAGTLIGEVITEHNGTTISIH